MLVQPKKVGRPRKEAQIRNPDPQPTSSPDPQPTSNQPVQTISPQTTRKPRRARRNDPADGGGASGGSRLYQAVKSFASPGISGRSSAPTLADWQPKFSRAIFYMSVLYVWSLTNDLDDFDDSDFVLDDERADMIASPFAKAFVASPINKRFGRTLLEHMDVPGAAMAMFTYYVDTKDLRRQKALRNAARATGQTNDNIIAMRKQQERVVAQQRAAQTASQPTPGTTHPIPTVPIAQEGEPIVEPRAPSSGEANGQQAFKPGQQHTID